MIHPYSHQSLIDSNDFLKPPAGLTIEETLLKRRLFDGI
jgi:hypothetical protein